MKELNMVADWYKKYNVPIAKDFTEINKDRIPLRIKMLQEEIDELVEADGIGDIEHIAKECADVVYVILGTVLEFGHIREFGEKTMFEEFFPNSDSKKEALGALVNDLHTFGKESRAYDLACLLWDVVEYIQFAGLKQSWDNIFAEVHRSNMSKGTNGKPVIREDGKILKGEDFSPANLSFLTLTVK